MAFSAARNCYAAVSSLFALGAVMFWSNHDVTSEGKSSWVSFGRKEGGHECFQ